PTSSKSKPTRNLASTRREAERPNRRNQRWNIPPGPERGGPTPRRKPRRIPSYRLHKPSGKAVVRLNGRDFCLGDHGTPESREAYDRLIAEWLGSGRRLAAVTASGDLTILELTDAFFAWCQERYVLPDGRASSEVNT